MIKIKERREEREQEIQGGWYLEEQMTKDLNYSKPPGFSCICQTMPNKTSKKVIVRILKL